MCTLCIALQCAVWTQSRQNDFGPSDLKGGSTRLNCSSRSVKSFAGDLSTRPTTYDVVRCCRYALDCQQSQRCRLIRCLFTLHDTKQHRTNPDLFFFYLFNNHQNHRVTASFTLSKSFHVLWTQSNRRWIFGPVHFSHLRYLYSIYASRQSFPEALATSATCVEQGCQGVAGEEAVHISSASFVVVTSKSTTKTETRKRKAV